MIELKNVSKIYGKKSSVFTALDDVSVSIVEGTSVAIIGKSGSGKTSILSEMGGSVQARGGKVRFMDPEARLDEKYAMTYGLKIPKTPGCLPRKWGWMWP